MANGPLFSTYRGGENRVTSSMMAVFQRLELSLLERLLGAVSGDSALQLVSFVNQPPDEGHSIPDARMTGNFDYWFEMSVAARKSALLAMRSPHLWPPEVRSYGHQMSSPLAEAST